MVVILPQVDGFLRVTVALLSVDHSAERKPCLALAEKSKRQEQAPRESPVEMVLGFMSLCHGITAVMSAHGREDQREADAVALAALANSALWRTITSMMPLWPAVPDLSHMDEMCPNVPAAVATLDW